MDSLCVSISAAHPSHIMNPQRLQREVPRNGISKPPQQGQPDWGGVAWLDWGNWAFPEVGVSKGVPPVRIGVD